MINILDIFIIMMLIMFVIVGFKRGVIKELVSLIGIIIIFILSWSLKNYIGNFLCIIFPFFKFIGPLKDIDAINILVYQGIAFMIVFVILLSLYSISLKISRVIQKIVNMTIILWLPSKILGGIVSLIKGYLIIMIISILLIIPFGNLSIFRESKIMNYMLYETPIISNYTDNFIEPVKQIYDLSNDISNETVTAQEANKRSINIMIKYKITNQSTVNDLIKLKKLNV